MPSPRPCQLAGVPNVSGGGLPTQVRRVRRLELHRGGCLTGADNTCVKVGVPNTGVERCVTLPMLRFPRSILSLTSLGQGLAGLVDGDHYFDTIAPDAVFEFRYRFPGWPTKLVGREALMALYAGYGEGMALHGADALVVNISQTPGVVILEYEVQGNAVGSGKLYENRFISVVTIEDRKIVGWRDYMDSLAAMSSLT